MPYKWAGTIHRFRWFIIIAEWMEDRSEEITHQRRGCAILCLGLNDKACDYYNHNE